MGSLAGEQEIEIVVIDYEPTRIFYPINDCRSFIPFMTKPELKVGDKVDYHSLIGGPMTTYGHEILKIMPISNILMAIISDVGWSVPVHRLTRTRDD